MLHDVEGIAREIGEYLKSRFGNPGDVSAKGPSGPSGRTTDLVTEVDFESERRIIEHVAAVSPGAAVLGEEGGACLPDGSPLVGALEDVEDLWIIDPLDGTVNFARSLPLFCVSIARYRFGVPAAGAIFAPMLNEMYTFDASEGGGAFLDGNPIQVSDRAAIDGIASLSGVGPHFREAARNFMNWRRIGSCALTMSWVACGRLDAYVQVENISPWDHAVAAPLVIEAGGVVTHFDLQPWVFPLEAKTGIITGSPQSHDVVAGVMRQLQAEA